MCGTEFQKYGQVSNDNARYCDYDCNEAFVREECFGKSFLNVYTASGMMVKWILSWVYFSARVVYSMVGLLVFNTNINSRLAGLKRTVPL